MAQKPTIAEVRSLFETDLSSEALQLLIDAENDDVILRFGEHAGDTQELRGGFAKIFLSRPADGLISIVETIGNAATTLAADDYEVVPGGWALRRLSTGTNPRGTWAARVKLSYSTPDDDRRKRVIIDLVKLSAQYSGLQVERAGDYSAHAKKYQTEREAILRGLRSGKRAFV